MRGPLGGGFGGTGGGSGAAPRIVYPESGQLCPVGLPFDVRALVPPGSTVTMRLGANAPVAMSVLGGVATGTLTPGAGDIGVATAVQVFIGLTTLSTTVDVEAQITYWVNFSIPASYVAVGTLLSAVKNLITGVASSAPTGNPQLFTDPRNSKPGMYLDGVSYFQPTDAAMLAIASGSDLPFTTIIVCSSALATATLVPFATANNGSVGNGTVWGQTAGKFFSEKLGSPSGPARLVQVEPVTAGICALIFHSANSLTIKTGLNGGVESSGVIATVSPPALTPNRVGLGVQPSSTPTFPFIGIIYEVIACGVDKTAPQIAAMIDRCVRFWRAKAPVVQFIGDSITTAQNATNGGMPALLPAAVAARGGCVDPDGPLAVGQPQPIRHSASSGNTPVDMNTRVISATQGLGLGGGSAGYYSRTILACIFAGTNFTGSGTDAQKAAQTAIDYSTLLNSTATKLAQAGSGWRIAVTPITAEGASPYPALYNALLPPIWDAFDVANPSNKLIRWDAYNALGPYDPLYYFDVTHPNSAGYVKMCNDPVYGLFQAIIPFILANQPPA